MQVNTQEEVALSEHDRKIVGMLNQNTNKKKQNIIPVSGSSPYVLRFLASSGVYFKITSAFVS